ncbi:Ribosomal protein S10 mitochondrial [Bienertia sinuspersici]
MSTKIRVVLSSFTRPLLESLPPHTRRVGLPETKKIYTVLRSPHIDKKSREQFETRVQKHVLDIKAERHELQQKLFWLKRHRMVGAQFEVQVFCKTRLDRQLLPLPQRKS